MTKFITNIILLIFLLTGVLFAQDSTNVKKTNHQKAKHGKYFVDKDGDGYNDNAPDHDGDGIPNGLDPDYLKIKKRNNSKLPYIDLDGDGINDNLQFNGQKRRGKFNRNFTKPQNGSMNNGEGGSGSGHQRQKGKKGNG